MNEHGSRTMRRGLLVLALVLLGALVSSVLPASAGSGRSLSRSAYRNGEGVFATSTEDAQVTPPIGPMQSGPVDVGELGPMATLQLPAGHFAIFAKAWVQRQGDVPEHVHCALIAENEADHARTQTGQFDASLSLELAHTLAEPGRVVLACANDADPEGRATLQETLVQHARIIAIRAPFSRG